MSAATINMLAVLTKLRLPLSTCVDQAHAANKHSLITRVREDVTLRLTGTSYRLAGVCCLHVRHSLGFSTLLDSPYDTIPERVQLPKRHLRLIAHDGYHCSCFHNLASVSA